MEEKSLPVLKGDREDRRFKRHLLRLWVGQNPVRIVRDYQTVVGQVFKGKPLRVVRHHGVALAALRDADKYIYVIQTERRFNRANLNVEEPTGRVKRPLSVATGGCARWLRHVRADADAKVVAKRRQERGRWSELQQVRVERSRPVITGPEYDSYGLGLAGFRALICASV